MALGDYGTILIKNGKVIQGQDDEVGYFRTKPESTLGFRITEENTEILNTLYAGDWDFHVGFYKMLFSFGKNGVDGEKNYLLYGDNPFKKKVWHLNHEGINIKIKQIQGNRYMMSFKLNGDFYHVYFGYGVEYKFMDLFKKKGWYGITNRELSILKRYYK